MEYVGRVPAPPLDRYIDDIYCLTGVPRHRRMNVPPMPSAHLFLNLGGPARLWDSDASVPSAVRDVGKRKSMISRSRIFMYSCWPGLYTPPLCDRMRSSATAATMMQPVTICCTQFANPRCEHPI